MANVMLIEGWGLAGTGTDYADLSANRKLAVLGWKFDGFQGTGTVTIEDAPGSSGRRAVINNPNYTDTFQDLMFRQAEGSYERVVIGFSTDGGWDTPANGDPQGGVGLGFSSEPFQSSWPVGAVSVKAGRDEDGITVYEYDGVNFSGTLIPASDTNFIPEIPNWVELVVDPGTMEAALWVNSTLVGTHTLTLSYPSSPFVAVNIGRQGRQDIDTTGLYGTIPIGALYVADERLGRCQVTTQRPSTDSAVEFSRPQGDSNASQVADPNGYDGDTTYVSSSTSGAEDLYGTDDPTGLTNERIHGVSVAVVGRKEDIGNRSITPVCAQGAAVAAGDPVTLEVGQYLGTQSVFSADPDTGLDWSLSGLNSSTFGVRLTD